VQILIVLVASIMYWYGWTDIIQGPDYYFLAEFCVLCRIR